MMGNENKNNRNGIKKMIFFFRLELNSINNNGYLLSHILIKDIEI